MSCTKTLVRLTACIAAFGITAAVSGSAASQHKKEEKEINADKVMQDWQLGPKLPEGWVEIDRKTAKITSKKHDDVFVLMTDGKSDLIIWYEKVGQYWKMSVIESVPSENHIRYGVDVKYMVLRIDGDRILYGETEAISYFKWDAKAKLFIRYIPGPPDP